MERVLTIRDLRKRFADHPALDGVSLEVSKGEVVALIGSSGSGKSTLLRCVSGLEPPDGGTVEIAGLPTQGEPAIAHKRMPVGMVFQSFNLYPHINALRNVATALRHVQRMSASEARTIAIQSLESVGMGEFAHRYPGELSGGQQQRVAIARALALRPELMLFDEPTSALDPETVGDVLAVIREIAEHGMTMLIATHEMAFAREVADRVVLMDQGKIREETDCRQFFAGPSTERGREFLRRFSREVSGLG